MKKAAALPLIFDKDPVAPRAANKANSTLSNATQFFQENILRQGLKRSQESTVAVGQKATDCHHPG